MWLYSQDQDTHSIFYTPSRGIDTIPLAIRAILWYDCATIYRTASRRSRGRKHAPTAYRVNLPYRLASA